MFRKTVILSVLALLIFGGTASGQTKTTTVKGTVLESSSKKPLGFASVSIKAQNNNFFDGSPTDYEGHYSVSGVPTDSLEITVSLTGYQDVHKTIYNDGSKEILTLNFSLSSVTELSEVSVSAMKSQMRFELDKKVFDVAASAITDGASASDILAEIPSINVETDGTISLRGSSSVVIWINGKESGLTADNQSEILEQFPAEAIQSVEVITNPSAKHSPEGTAGIINIVLKNNVQKGYYGSVQAGINTNLGYNVGGNINYASEKVDLMANLGYRSHSRFSSESEHRTMLNSARDSIGFANSEGEYTHRSHHLFARLGATFHVTKRDDISLFAMGMFGNGKRGSTVFQSSNFDGFDHSTRLTDTRNRMLGGSASLGYKHTFRKDHTLDMTFDYSIWNRNGKTWYTDEEFYTLPTEYVDDFYQYQSSLMQNNSFNLKADYVNKFNENHRIEAGYQGRFNRQNAPTNTYDGETKDELIFNTNLSNTYVYDIYVNAIYATYAAKFGHFNFQAGLRGEHTHTAINSIGYPVTTKDYFDIFPSLFLNYELPKENQLQLNYTRRIMRPGGRELNPFKRINDSKNISFGNPLINPEYANAVELNYIKTWANHMFSLSGYFRNTDNKIQRISYLQGDVMYTTPENIAKDMATGAELVSKNRLAKFLNLTTTLNLFYYQLDGFSYTVPSTSYVVSGEGRSSFTWNLRMNAQVMLPWDMSLQLSGGYDAPQVTAQGTRNGMFRLGAGLKKSVNNWTFNVNARNLLSPLPHIETHEGKNFRQTSSHWSGRVNINFSVTYAFGNINKKMKQQRQQDVQQGSGMDDQIMMGDDM